MSDSERTFLDDAIMEVLPELPAVNRNILVEHLQSIGVEMYDDLRFVTEADVITALRPVQARKLLSAWKQKCKLKTTHNVFQHVKIFNLLKMKSRHGFCVILYSLRHNIFFSF